MGHNHNGVSLKEYLKHMDEQLAMIKKKRDEIKEREKWQIHEKNLELKELICVGSFCTVHRGVYRNDKESIDVAVKVFEWGEESKETERVATSRKTFLREVSIWHNLEHPNIAKMIGGIYNAAGCYGEIERFENNGLVVMNYILRGNLKSYIIEHSKIKIPFDVVMKFALGLARGLNYLHSKKIVHRNVKPENILLDEKLNVKLSNFKVACFEPEYPKRENNFDDSAVVKADSYSDTDTAMNHYKLTGVTGTMGYMAPEVYRKDTYDHKCDVYSFGMCLWEMYCCEEILSGYMFNYESFRPRVPRCCPKSFGKVIVKCWEPEPEKRPEMSEILRLLEDIDISKGKGMTPEESLSLFSCAMARLMKI